jgi:hypothetical protein
MTSWSNESFTIGPPKSLASFYISNYTARFYLVMGLPIVYLLPPEGVEILEKLTRVIRMVMR